MIVTFDIGLHEVCVRVGGRSVVRYVITKFSWMDSLPNFVTHGAPLHALRYESLEKIDLSLRLFETGNLLADNFKKYSTSMGRHLSQRYGQVILVSGYPVLTAVN